MCGARQHGASDDNGMDPGLVAEGLPDLGGHSLDVTKIEAAVGATRRPDTEKGNFRRPNRLAYIAGGPQSPDVRPLSLKASTRKWYTTPRLSVCRVSSFFDPPWTCTHCQSLSGAIP